MVIVLGILFVWVLTIVISLAVVDIVKWSDLHTIGDFFAPTENKIDSVIFYIPGANIAVASVILAMVILVFADDAVNKLKECKFFNPIRKLFKKKIK